MTMNETLKELLADADGINDKFILSEIGTAEAYTALYAVLEQIAHHLQPLLITEEKRIGGIDYSLWKKFKDIIAKVDRKKTRGGGDDALVYFALCELIDKLDRMAKAEPEAALIKGKMQRNLNIVMLEAAKDVREKYDKKLRISYWPG